MKQSLVGIDTPIFTDSQFHEIRSFFSRLSGNKLDADKRALVESRLRKCIMDLGVTPTEYIKLVKTESEEQRRFITALTTHKTDWFRENVHFDFIKRKIDEQKSNRTNDFLVWSAACSSGEEVYTLLMSFLEKNEPQVKILGTDISENCLQIASNGVFSPSLIHSQVPANLIKKYFLSGIVNGEKLYKFNPEYTKNIKWRSFNLINSDLPSVVNFDFILLRNVLIYFDQETAFMVIERLSKYLKKGGYFIVGLSETIYKAEDLGLRRVENSIYQKI